MEQLTTSSPDKITEGIVLQSLPFQDYDRIITLLTPGGLLRLFAKGRSRTLPYFHALTTPLTVGEFVYREGKEGLSKLYKGEILLTYKRIRLSLEALETAMALATALLHTQWPGKQASSLYALTRLFLQEIDRTEYPSRLVAPFQIKLLLHEGSFQREGGCSSCLAHGTHRWGGEKYCASHAPEGALSFSPEEEETLLFYAQSRSLGNILSRDQDAGWQKKIGQLFAQALL